MPFLILNFRLRPMQIPHRTESCGSPNGNKKKPGSKREAKKVSKDPPSLLRVQPTYQAMLIRIEPSSDVKVLGLLMRARAVTGT